MAVLLLLGATACTDAPGRTDLHVFAASSLTEAFTDLAETFEAEHRDVDVVLNLAASSTLARQIEEGAAADVFASADARQMTRLGPLIDAPVAFARTRLVIAVPEGNPAGITGLASLADPGPIVVLCAEQVPCGTYAEEVFDAAGIEVDAASREANVKAVLTKVRLGEADAGIVYGSDIAEGVEAVDIRAARDVIATYPVAALAAARNAALADTFITLLRSGAGRRVLRAHGFDA